MKKIKNILKINFGALLVLSMVASLVVVGGCGGKNDNNKQKPSNTKNTPTPQLVDVWNADFEGLKPDGTSGEIKITTKSAIKIKCSGVDTAMFKTWLKGGKPTLTLSIHNGKHKGTFSRKVKQEDMANLTKLFNKVGDTKIDGTAITVTDDKNWFFSDEAKITEFVTGAATLSGTSRDNSGSGGETGTLVIDLETDKGGLVSVVVGNGHFNIPK